MSTVGNIPPEYQLEPVESQTAATVPPRYDLNQVYVRAFSHVRPPYPTLLAQSRSLGVSPAGTFRALKGAFNLNSVIGTQLTLPTSIDVNPISNKNSGWQMPNEPTVEIRGGKNIIETPLNRGIRVQNVIEEVNLNNYEIRIRGVIINEEDDVYPDLDVRRLREYCEAPGSIYISNGILAIFNISQVVVRDFDFFEVKGYAGAQAYELSLVSDQDFDFEVVDEPERL